MLELDLRGDHVNLDRYLSAGAEPSSRPEFTIAELRALPVKGAISFDEARFSGTQMKQVRLEVGSRADMSARPPRLQGRHP